MKKLSIIALSLFMFASVSAVAAGKAEAKAGAKPADATMAKKKDKKDGKTAKTSTTTEAGKKAATPAPSKAATK